MTKTRYARFFEKIDKGVDDDKCCWIWKGSRSGSGYGQFWNGKRNIPAHRFLVVDFMPEGKEACHQCDNKLCVRPDHIFIGTRSDNMQDCVSKGRLRPQNGFIAMLKVRNQRGSRNHECKLTEAQAIEAKNCSRVRGAATALAKRFGVSLTVICDIRDGKRWVHL